MSYEPGLIVEAGGKFYALQRSYDSKGWHYTMDWIELEEKPMIQERNKIAMEISASVQRNNNDDPTLNVASVLRRIADEIERNAMSGGGVGGPGHNMYSFEWSMKREIEIEEVKTNTQTALEWNKEHKYIGGYCGGY